MILTGETEVLGDKPVTVPFWLSQRLHGVARDGTEASALFNEVNRNNMGIQHLQLLLTLCLHCKVQSVNADYDCYQVTSNHAGFWFLTARVSTGWLMWGICCLVYLVLATHSVQC